MEDNLMPGDNTYAPLREPVEQEIERKKEKADTLQALPILEDLLNRIEDKVKFYQDVRNIDDGIRLDPKTFLIAHNTNAGLAHGWQQELNWIQEIIDEAIGKSR